MKLLCVTGRSKLVSLRVSEENEREQNCVYVRQEVEKKDGSEEDMRKKIRKTHGIHQCVCERK